MLLATTSALTPAWHEDGLHVHRLLPETLQNHPEYRHTPLAWQTKPKLAVPSITHIAIPKSCWTKRHKRRQAGEPERARSPALCCAAQLTVPRQGRAASRGHGYIHPEKMPNYRLGLNKLKLLKKCSREEQGPPCAARKSWTRHFYNFKLGLHASANYDK